MNAPAEGPRAFEGRAKPEAAGVAESIAWALASQVGRQLGVFVTTVALARYLTPEDFGLIGMATVFTGLVAILNDVGVSGALVQRRDIDGRHLSSMFWVNQVLGGGLCALTVVASPAIAGFFDSPGLTAILPVLSFAFIASALGIVQQSVLIRQLDFRRLGIIETVAVLLAGAAAIVAAALGLGVWSLVLQLLLAPSLTTVGLWASSAWRPARVLDRAALSELLPFGLNMAGFNVVNYFSRNLDYLLVGSLLGAAALGYYTLAYRLMVYPLQAVSQAVARVSFPAFSRAAADVQALAEGFLKMVKGVSLATFPMVAGIFAVAPDFVHVVYGPKWAKTAELLRVLCVAGLVQSVGTTVGAVYQSLGRPGLQLRMALLNVTFTAIALAIGARWGLMGIAAAYAAFAVCWVHFSIFVVTRLLGLPFGRLYARLGPSFLASMIMLAIVMAARGSFAQPSVVSLLATAALGAAVQTAVLMALGELRWIGLRPVFQLR